MNEENNGLLPGFMPHYLCPGTYNGINQRRKSWHWASIPTSTSPMACPKSSKNQKHEKYAVSLALVTALLAMPEAPNALIFSSGWTPSSKPNCPPMNPVVALNLRGDSILFPGVRVADLNGKKITLTRYSIQAPISKTLWRTASEAAG